MYNYYIEDVKSIELLENLILILNFHNNKISIFNLNERSLIYEHEFNFVNSNIKSIKFLDKDNLIIYLDSSEGLNLMDLEKNANNNLGTNSNNLLILIFVLKTKECIKLNNSQETLLALESNKSNMVKAENDLNKAKNIIFENFSDICNKQQVVATSTMDLQGSTDMHIENDKETAEDVYKKENQNINLELRSLEMKMFETIILKQKSEFSFLFFKLLKILIKNKMFYRILDLLEYKYLSFMVNNKKQLKLFILILYSFLFLDFRSRIN